MRYLILGVAALALTGNASAYELKDLVRDGRAYHAKMMTEVGDLKIEQEATFHGKGAGSSGIKSVTYRKGNKWRSDGTMSAGGMSSAKGQSFDATTLYDGKDMWSVAMGIKSKVPGPVQKEPSALVYWSEPAPESKVTGEETVNGRACWVAETAAPAGAPGGFGGTKVWIDKKKFVYVQTDAMLSGESLRSVYSDFRKVKGDFEIPYQVDTFSKGQKTMTAKITKLEAGSGLSDDLFDPSKIGSGATTIDTDALMKQAEEMRKKAQAQSGTGGK